MPDFGGMAWGAFADCAETKAEITDRNMVTVIAVKAYFMFDL